MGIWGTREKGVEDMRKFAMAFAVASVIGAVNGAQAADLRDYGGSMKDEPYAAPAAIWSGFYVGGHLGGLWTDSGKSHGLKWDWCDEAWYKTDKIKFEEDDDDTTLIGGIHIGYNWQTGSKVFGVEGDISFGDGVDYLASLRGRLGHAFDNLLVYVTAGVAFVGFDDQDIKASTYWNDYDLKISGDSDVGAVVGAGVEYKLSSNWSVGVEGLYYFFGDNEDEVIFGAYDNKKLVHEDDNDMFVVRGRVSYHFADDRYDAPLK